MNTANLQLEGMLMALAHLNALFVSKGLLSADEIDEVLHRAEAGLTSEERLIEDLSPANRDAVCFPIRVLRIANRRSGEIEPASFSTLAKAVAQRKEPYNDQR